MELTRRDAIAALAAIGGAGGAVAGYDRLRSSGSAAESPPHQRSERLPDDDHVRETMIVVAEVLYPSELSGIEQFVREFLDGRVEDDGHGDGIREAVAELDEQARNWYDGPVVELSLETRHQLLEGAGVDIVDADPTGSAAERIRYFVVNELLLALYASPAGGELVGIENPQGHPGGTESYQRGPAATRD